MALHNIVDAESTTTRYVLPCADIKSPSMGWTGYCPGINESIINECFPLVRTNIRYTADSAINAEECKIMLNIIFDAEAPTLGYVN
jgi:hypothetical protein